MKSGWTVVASVILFSQLSTAASRPHVVVLGKWTIVKWQAEDNGNASDVKVRPLLVDGRIKEFTVGPAHDVTEHIFVVQRMFRLNDSLPQEPGPARWVWQKGGWLLVDRASGRVQPITLPEFDPYRSQANWFRDYIA